MRACTCQKNLNVKTLFIFHIQKALWRNKAALAKVSWPEDVKQRMVAAMMTELMSSECDDVSGDEKLVVVKSLPWRFEELDTAVKVLDEKHKSTQSDQGIRQTMKRIRCGASNRPMPRCISATLMWTVKPLE